MSERILVVGLGGIGGVIGASLAEAGHDVTALGRPASVLAAAGGVVLRDGRGERRVPALRAVSELPDARFDLVLLATQPHQVEAAARQALPALAEGGQLVVLQNGLCEERVAAIAGQHRVTGAVTTVGASSPAPGVVERTSHGSFVVGRIDGGRDEKLLGLCLLLSSIAPARVTDNLLGARWSKLALNCAVSTLGTIAGDRLGAVLVHAFARRLGLEIITEALAVARAEGVRLESVGQVDLERLSLRPGQRAGLSLAFKHGVLLAAGARYRRLRSSMLTAIERGLEPPVDFLNGEVVERGLRHRIPTPANRSVLEAVRGIARGDLKPGLGTLREVHRRARALLAGPGALAS